jgi:SAM-dependent methyltransferase
MSESYVFNWNPADYEKAVRSCEEDDAVALALEYLDRKMSILEAGAGVGRIVGYLTGLGYNVEGVEINGAVVRALKLGHPELRIWEGDVGYLDVPGNWYGAILAFGLIEHFERGPAEVLAEFRRTLKKGGICVVTVPSMNLVRQERRRKAEGDPWYRCRRGGEHYEYWFRPEEIELECAAAGFEIVDSRPISHMDGMYHEKLGEVTHDHWRFHPTEECVQRNKELQQVRWYHNHMHGLVLKKVP